MDLSKTSCRARARSPVARLCDFATRKDTAGVARRSAAIALVIRLTSAGLAYFAQVVFARLMGQYEYGVFAYTWVWFLVFSAVATLGFGDSPVRYVAQLRERGEDAYLRGFIRFAPLVMLVSSVAFGALLIAALPLRRRPHRARLPDADGAHGGVDPLRLPAGLLRRPRPQLQLDDPRAPADLHPAPRPAPGPHGRGRLARLRGDGADRLRLPRSSP